MSTKDLLSRPLVFGSQVVYAHPKKNVLTFGQVIKAYYDSYVWVVPYGTSVTSPTYQIEFKTGILDPEARLVSTESCILVAGPVE